MKLLFLYIFKRKILPNSTVYIQDFVQFYSFMEFRNKHECIVKVLNKPSHCT